MNIEISLLRRRLPSSLSRKLPAKISVVAITERESRIFNRQFRKKDRATNVLSFRYGPDYGEILICPAVIRREARIQGNPARYQMTWMILHGMIHLLGMHHERSRAVARRVESLEQKILGEIFNKNPS